MALFLIVFFALLGFLLDRLVGGVSAKVAVTHDSTAIKIDALLPQTQCEKCGYPGCKPYAEAVANGEAINKCIPGGQSTIEALAKILGRDVIALDGEAEAVKKIAFIREAECIGCTKCIQACPVDAILGAAKLMHSVIQSECTGCDLCVEPCPVNCIDMIPLANAPSHWRWTKP